MLYIECPDCSNPLKVGPDHIGDTVTCPACGRAFVMSEPGTKPADLVREVAPEPMTEEQDEDDSPPASEIESIPAPRSRLSTAIRFVAGFVAFVVILIGVWIMGERASKPAHPPIVLSDSQQAYLNQLAASQESRELGHYHAMLDEIRNTKSEIEFLRKIAWIEGAEKPETAFANDRVPENLQDALRRSKDSLFRRLREQDIVEMDGPDREAARVKDAAEDRQLRELREQFDRDLAQGKIRLHDGSKKYQRFRNLVGTLPVLEAKCDALEVKLLPRLSRDELSKERQIAQADLKAGESELQTVKLERDEAYSWAFRNAVSLRLPLGLEHAIWRSTDSTVKKRRQREIAEMANTDRDAAQRKDADEDRKVKAIEDELMDEIKRGSLPLSMRLDSDYMDIEEYLRWLNQRVSRLHSRCTRLEALGKTLEAK
jgi:ribosomal protein S27E